MNVRFYQMLFLHQFIWWCDFSSLTWIILTDFQMLNQTCKPGINLTWSWNKQTNKWKHSFLFTHCWIEFANPFWGFLHLSLWEIPVCSFLFCTIFGFCMRVILVICLPSTYNNVCKNVLQILTHSFNIDQASAICQIVYEMLTSAKFSLLQRSTWLHPHGLFHSFF